ncbi:type II toxin-antitoxin system RelE/ParE family toxin [Zoogloea sp.]|uniref:type II toxin-antitoxin system RelE/ParE family toxin n=1 Tax=Zoogloea sp. TaxID=49181 RepID=UPI0035AEFBB4
MKVVVHPGAEQDLMEAVSFYEREGSHTLAARFVTEFKRVTALISDYPDIGVSRGNGLQGVTMAIFPYTLIYRRDPSQIRILVVKHDRRRPSYGSRRA